MKEVLESLADEEFCYLTTTGRITGEPHEIEIWFALLPQRNLLYMMAGSRYRSDWIRNLIAEPEVSIRVSDAMLRAKARLIEGDPDEPEARRLLVEKYEREDGNLTGWGSESLPVAFDVFDYSRL